MTSFLSYKNQDLRNRSFKGQELQGADFSGADIRGCDFSRSQLSSANFMYAQTGQTRRQQGIWLAIIIATFLTAGHGVSRLVFGCLGQTPSDRAWSYVIALLISLGIAGGCGGLRVWLQPASRLQALLLWLSAIASAALVSFFYAGMVAGKDPRWAIAGAIAGGIAMAGLAVFKQTATMLMVITLTGAIAAYGGSFLVGATAIAWLTTGHWLGGSLFALLSLLYLWFTWQSFLQVVQELRQAPGTLFRRANLTQAHFIDARLSHTDFSGAIGWKKETRA